LRAADEAIKIASMGEKSMIDLVYVVDFDKVKSDVLHSQSKTAIDYTRRKHLLPFEHKLKGRNINYEINILNVYPGPTNIKVDNESSTYILIIGSRGLNALQEMVLGSVRHIVVKRVEASVLIVK